MKLSDSGRSMAIESLLLQGQDQAAMKALERLELIRTQLDEGRRPLRDSGQGGLTCYVRTD